MRWLTRNGKGGSLYLRWLCLWSSLSLLYRLLVLDLRFLWLLILLEFFSLNMNLRRLSFDFYQGLALNSFLLERRLKVLHSFSVWLFFKFVHSVKNRAYQVGLTILFLYFGRCSFLFVATKCRAGLHWNCLGRLVLDQTHVDFGEELLLAVNVVCLLLLSRLKLDLVLVGLPVVGLFFI